MLIRALSPEEAGDFAQPYGLSAGWTKKIKEALFQLVAVQ